MAAEIGNEYAAKGRIVEKLIQRITIQENGKRLRQGVELLMDKVAEGDMKALEFVTDRLDGKPKQSLDANVTGELTITKIVHEIIDPANNTNT